MKFTFYLENKKKKQQVIKAKTKEDIINVAKVAKCELTKNSILKDLDFSSNGKLICIVKNKEYNMKELWNLLNKKLQLIENNKNKDDKKEKSKKKKSNNKKKKSNKIKKKDKKINKHKEKNKESNGLVHITRR